MANYAVKATARDFLTSFSLFDNNTQERIYDALFQEIYLSNIQLDEMMHLPVSNEKEGEKILGVFSSKAPVTKEVKFRAYESELVEEEKRVKVVPSSGRAGKNHLVSLGAAGKSISCTCEDFVINYNTYCKHMRAVDQGLY